MAEKLFTEFPPVSTSEWEEVIKKDLKGADYEKKLVWRTIDGFSVRPYYRAEDLAGLKYAGKHPGEFPFIRGTRQDNEWFIHESICCRDNDFARANREARLLLEKGVESLGFHIDEDRVITTGDFATLLEGIAIETVPVHFCGCCIRTSESLDNFLRYVDTTNADKDEVKAFFDFAPVSVLTRKGHFCEEKAFNRLAECIRAAAPYRNIRVIAIDGFIFNSCGASSTQELAYSISEGSEYLSRLSEMGLPVELIAGKMYFKFGVGSSYFMEIAKFRAARMLWANVVNNYGCNCKCAEKMVVCATTSEYNQTVYDSYVNMLRGTTEAMSAAIAGVDYMEVTPFDASFRVPNDFSNRIARNVQNILKEEARFNKVTDPGAGSYYIEMLTEKIADAAWDMFRKTEEEGGFIANFKAGKIQSEIKAVSEKKDKNAATRRETILGTNQYPNFIEKASDEITKDIVSRDIPTVMGKRVETHACHRADNVEPLRPYRVAQEFEALRLATDRSGKEPKAFMLTFGNLAMCRARAQFSSNFFAVAGIRITDNNRFESIEEGVKAAIASKAEIVVACSSDDEYAAAVPEIARLLGDKAILVVAGEPACKEELQGKGISNFISVKSNVLETLRDYQAKLGIKPL
ncbi:MAG TPA: methylmalonyl-CoA mutase small subunit [Candidatus Coprenecus stercoripullorum]|nr:methylmalonyl-CoA mutase small subunit [Candidatus Coprenecus stercoripullorum]